MTEPWNFTEAQRRLFREAHAETKRKSMDELLHTPALNRCRAEDGTLLDRPHPERVRLVKER